MDRVQVIGLANHLPVESPRLFIKNPDLTPDHRKLCGALLFGDQGLQRL